MIGGVKNEDYFDDPRNGTSHNWISLLGGKRNTGIKIFY